MKRIICLLIIVCFVFTGCTLNNNNNNSGGKIILKLNHRINLEEEKEEDINRKSVSIKLGKIPETSQKKYENEDYFLEVKDYIKNNLNSDGNAILKGFLDHSFLIDYFVLDSVNVSKREQKRKIAKRAILLLTEEIHRIISLLISMGVKIDDEQLLKMIAQEIKNERAQRLVGAEDVKKKFQSAMDDYLERTKEYL